MKKLKYAIIVLAIIASIFLISSKVQAVEINPGVTTINITSPATGEYTTGQSITFVVTFNKDVVGVFNTSDELKITFSESKIERTISKGTVNNNTITYQYTLKSEDKGELSLVEYIAMGTKEGGQAIMAGLSEGSNGEFDNNVKIIANKNQGGTTPSEEYAWTDASKIKMSLTRVQGTERYYDVALNVTGLELGKDYYFYVVNGSTKPTVATEASGRIDNATFFITANSSTEVKRNLAQEVIEKNGDIYVWIYEVQKDKTNVGKFINKCIISGTKLQRPAQNKLGSRMLCYFFSTYTSNFVFEPTEDLESRKVNLKIGTITDKSILRSIQKGESDCLSKLLSYAKNAKNPIYNGKISAGSLSKNPSITGNMNLVDKAYYYCYMELENENGKYYPVEDVSLYQACISESIGKNLWDYLDGNFKWDLGDDGEPSKPNTPSTPINTQKPTTDNTTATGKLPQTGVNSVVIISILGIAIVAAVVGARKYKEYNIKY